MPQSSRVLILSTWVFNIFFHWVSAVRPPDSLLQLAFSSWLVARKQQHKVFSDPVYAQDPSKSSVSFCPAAHDPVPHIRSDVLAAAADVREAWGEQDAITEQKPGVWMVAMWETGVLLKELPSCYSSVT